MRLALDHLRSDIRYALRQFARRPGLTAAALLALAGGLGSVITVFALVDAVILRPLPVRAPHELVWLRDPSFSFPVFQEVEARGSMLGSVFAWEARTMQAQWAGVSESTPVLLASGRIHETLGLRAAAAGCSWIRTGTPRRRRPSPVSPPPGSGISAATLCQRPHHPNRRHAVHACRRAPPAFSALPSAAPPSHPAAMLPDADDEALLRAAPSWLAHGRSGPAVGDRPRTPAFHHLAHLLQATAPLRPISVRAT